MNNGSRAECSHGGGEAVPGQDDSRASEQWKCAFVLSTVDGGLLDSGRTLFKLYFC